MVVLSAKNICLVHFAFLNAVAYKLLTGPAQVSGHGFVFMIGRAMGLFGEDDPAVGLAAIALVNLSVVDLAAAMAPGTVFLELSVPFRLMLAFTVCGFAYMSDANIALSNSAVFSLGFVDLSVLFWLYVTLREERRLLVRVQE